MTILVPIALFGWIPVVLLLFAVLPPRRAVLVAFVAAWLFLPMAGYELQGMPNFTKMSATSLGVMLGIVLFDSRRFSTFKPAWYDLPMAVWLTVPMAASVINGYGAYDGLSAVVEHAIHWGVPYFVGRVYFRTLPALRDLAVAILIGGLIYVPLCLYEIRMSPQLHTMLYGFHQHVFVQSQRFGGWRPTVFMQHGLAVGMWMATATLLGIWLWQTRAVRHIHNVPMTIILPVLILTTLLCKSVGAVGLLALGAVVLWATKLTRTASLIMLLVLVAPTYLTARVALGWDGQQLVSLADRFQRDRADSLDMRLYNEERIVAVAKQQPLFGWGRWAGYRQVEDRERAVVTDSLWIIALGQNGFIGLGALTAIMLLPPILLFHRTRGRWWHHPELAPATGLAVVVVLFFLDSLFNSMLNPIYLLAAGGLAGLTTLQIRRDLEAK